MRQSNRPQFAKIIGDQRQAIIWVNANNSLIGILGANFGENLIQNWKCRLHMTGILFLYSSEGIYIMPEDPLHQSNLHKYTVQYFDFFDGQQQLSRYRSKSNQQKQNKDKVWVQGQHDYPTINAMELLLLQQDCHRSWKRFTLLLSLDFDRLWRLGQFSHSIDKGLPFTESLHSSRSVSPSVVLSSR